jgi:hypothetical protein
MMLLESADVQIFTFSDDRLQSTEINKMSSSQSGAMPFYWVSYLERRLAVRTVRKPVAAGPSMSSNSNGGIAVTKGHRNTEVTERQLTESL